jgi:hypothetical protein
MTNVYPDLSSEAIALRLSARAPQLAFRDHVAEHGSEAARKLYILALEYDLVYFGGRLGNLMIEIASPASPSALATHEPSSPEGVACVIRIARSVVEAGEALAADALLHEMVHVFQTATDAREPGYQGHGPGFAAKCNEIGAQLGLPPVGVKGRAKRGQAALPDCAQWPLNVRPEGYYGDAPRAGKAVARATKARKPRAAKSAPTPAQSSEDAVLVAIRALAACTPDERSAVLAQLGLAACPA